MKKENPQYHYGPHLAGSKGFKLMVQDVLDSPFQQMFNDTNLLILAQAVYFILLFQP